MRSFLLILFLPLCPLFASSESVASRVRAHLLIGNSSQAIEEVQKGLLDYPEEPHLYELALKSLGAEGSDREMVALWERYANLFPEKARKQEVLEQLSWGILRKGLHAPGITSQMISIIGAALAQDMYAVAFLLEGLRHTNAHIRALSVKLASLYGDYPLREEILRLFQRERVPEVRFELIKAISQLKMQEQMPALMALLSDPKTGAKEQAVAIEAIVNFRDSIDHEELLLLVKSKRAPLRMLGCEVIAHCRLKEEAPLFNELLCDTHPDVQKAALKGMGLLRLPATERVKELARDAKEAAVGITAGWVWLLAEPEKGEEALGKWLSYSDPKVQAYAAAALAAAGPYGIELAKHYLPGAEDSYVQANLALALITQREACDQAGAILAAFLQTNQERWMRADEGLFHPILKSTLTHNPSIPNFPEVVNQTVRLEILNLLAILEYPGTQEAIKAFLKERRFGVTGLAAEMLLGEGDETALDQVRALLEDADPAIRAEAALVLATWGRDPTALPYLLEVYPKGDRQLKIKILESLGRIGDREAIPFLLERLKDPSLMMRMIAASILIQVINA